MKARRGQVAIYLVLALVAIAVLMLMNVNVFLAVRSKNRLMNAVDAAAVAAARHQGALLNRLGEMNVEHLRAAIRNELWEGEAAMRELAMFGPLEAVAESARAAADWGFDGPADDRQMRVFRAHQAEIADYAANPDLYPEYREGLWNDYAAAFGQAVQGMVAAPGYLEMPDAWRQEPLLNAGFYDAIAARAWCWFGIGDRERYFDYDSKTMPRPTGSTAGKIENSEVFSLHVTFGSWLESDWKSEYDPVAGGFSERWTNFVCQVSGCSREELAASVRIASPTEIWCFYDDYWGSWSRTFNTEKFPVAGNVKAEYDVAGCAASCLLSGNVQQLLEEDDEAVRGLTVSAEAKPFGKVIDGNGAEAPVTAYGRFVAPSAPGGRIFTRAELVPYGSVPRAPGVSTDPVWYEHVRSHLETYLVTGHGVGSCFYCVQLEQWESPAFRAAAREWLLQNGNTCRVEGGAGTERGGYDYAH